MGVVAFLFGLIIGSFLNVCIYRIPRKESIAFPSSHCTSCHTPLKTRDLFPIISFIVRKGRCGYCKTKISFRYPLIEFLTGLLFYMIFRITGISYELGFYLFYVSLLLVIGWIDYDHQIIPDSLVITMGLGGLGYRFISSFLNFTWEPWLEGGLGIVLGGGFFLLLALLSKGGIGGGDIKLMAVLGLWLGYRNILAALFFTFLIGGLFSVFLLLLKKKRRKDRIPFGPFLCLGGGIGFLWGESILNAYIHYFMN